MKNIKMGENYQSWIDQLKSYQKKAPKLYNPDVKKSDSSFDVNHYFEILDNIKLEKGWSADYLYLKDCFLQVKIPGFCKVFFAATQ